MATRIIIRDPEAERARRYKRLLFVVVLLISLSVFLIPPVRQTASRRQMLSKAGEIARFLSSEKTKAALRQKSFFLKFLDSNTLEVGESPDCAWPLRVESIQRFNLNSREQDDYAFVNPSVDADPKIHMLGFFCHHPAFGAHYWSAKGEKQVQGDLFFGHSKDVRAGSWENFIHLLIQNEGGEISFE